MSASRRRQKDATIAQETGVIVVIETEGIGTEVILPNSNRCPGGSVRDGSKMTMVMLSRAVAADQEHLRQKLRHALTTACFNSLHPHYHLA